jgi:hypothetical protein
VYRPGRLHPRILKVLLHSRSDIIARGRSHETAFLHAAQVAWDLDIELVFWETVEEEGPEAVIKDGFEF